MAFAEGEALDRAVLEIEIEKWPLKAPFRITGYTFTAAEGVCVSIRRSRFRGRGEASGVYYRGETPASMAVQIESVRAQLESDLSHQTIAELLPAGGARNAVDCALWELEAQQSGTPVWQLAGLSAPQPLLTTYTVAAASPAEMAQTASTYAGAEAIKLKLTDDDLNAERVRAVRVARPDVWLGIDANQGFTRESLERLLPVLVTSDVKLIEQPLPVGRESELEGFKCPIPIAADESMQDVDDLARLAAYFDVVNVKLDKCGGLTQGLAMAREARRRGLQVMVGNMVGTSLAMAPAFLVGQLCDIVDLDGPIFLARDRNPAVRYTGGRICCAPEVWGGGAAFSSTPGT